MDHQRHIPKIPKVTCLLKHRSQPGIPRDLFEAMLYVLPLGGIPRP